MNHIAALCVLAVGWPVAVAAAPLAALQIDKESIAQMRKQHQLAIAEVNDPVYKRKQRYEGFWLRDVLTDLSAGLRLKGDVYVRFRCKDGYLPVMPLARAMAGKGLIAIRDANSPQGQDWQIVPSGGSSSIPAPSYLVWIDPPGGPEEYPWPYQMIAVELISSSEVLPAAGFGSSRRGRDLFAMHCMKCHSINGVGGTLGPELNSPCSVTEYWNPRLLRRFIEKASSVRSGARMPDFTSLPEKDIEDMVGYLQSVAGHKSPGAACP